MRQHLNFRFSFSQLHQSYFLHVVCVLVYEETKDLRVSCLHLVLSMHEQYDLPAEQQEERIAVLELPEVVPWQAGMHYSFWFRG